MLPWARWRRDESGRFEQEICSMYMFASVGVSSRYIYILVLDSYLSYISHFEMYRRRIETEMTLESIRSSP